MELGNLGYILVLEFLVAFAGLTLVELGELCPILV